MLRHGGQHRLDPRPRSDRPDRRLGALDLPSRSTAAAPGANRITGSFLRERYGADYLAIGMLFGRGSFAALNADHLNLLTIDLPPAPDHFLSAAFSRAGIRRGVLDLRALPTDGLVVHTGAASHPGDRLVFTKRNGDDPSRGIARTL